MSQATDQTLDPRDGAPSERSREAGGFNRRFARYAKVLALGILSVALYVLLYWFNGDIKGLAQVTNAGDKSLFFIPIIVALIFSLVHGAFTSQFWDALGVKAKKS